jgi:hypothetical protein
LQHRGRHVDADDSAIRSDAPGREEHVDAGARAKVEHVLTGLKLQVVNRRAAEAKVGSAKLSMSALE